MPLPLYEGLSGRRLTTILKAKRFTGAQRLAVLQRRVQHLRHAWPDTLVLLRGDSHVAYPEGMQGIDEQPALHYVTGWTSKAVLQKLAREVVEQAKRAAVYRGRKVPRFHSPRSQAQPWARSRRVVIKVEGSEQGVNPRLVVTDMEQARTHVLSQHLYCTRGQAENAIKAHQLSLKSDRPACHRFEAKQFRLVLPSAASVLLETWRREVFRTTQWASATMETSQWRLLKLGARVQECKDRITISFPSSCPVAPVLRRSLTLLAGGRVNVPVLW
jgi:Transposase DDE domain group 1